MIGLSTKIFPIGLTSNDGTTLNVLVCLSLMFDHKEINTASDGDDQQRKTDADKQTSQRAWLFGGFRNNRRRS